MSRFIRMISPWLFVVLLVGCGGKGDGDYYLGNYSFGGHPALESVMRATTSRFLGMYGARISYDSLGSTSGMGSSAGVQGLLSGIYAVAAIARPLRDNERSSGAVSYRIASEGIAVIVNTDTVVLDNLSLQQVIGIYSGEIIDWSEVGGPSVPIVVFNREDASELRAAFRDVTLRSQGQDQDFLRDNVIIASSDDDMISGVSSTPYSIGYCGFTKLGPPGFKAISIGEVYPSEMNVQQGLYPLARQIFLVTMGQPKSDSMEEAFVNFVLSEEGQGIVQEEGFVPYADATGME